MRNWEGHGLRIDDERFILTDQEELEYYLGVEVSETDRKYLVFHNTDYAKKYLWRFKMTEWKPVKASLSRD